MTFGEATDRPSTGSIRLPRRYWVFLAARVVTLSGSAMAPVALALALLDRQRDATGLGVVLLMDVLGQLTFALVGGVLGDRRGAGWALVVGNAVSGVAQAGAGILIAFDNPPIAGIAMMSFVLGAANAFVMPSGGTAIVELVSGTLQIERATSINRATSHAIRVGGPLGAAILVATVGAAPVLAWDAISFGLAAVIFHRLRLRLSVAGTMSARDLFADGWKQLLSHRWLVATLAQFAFVSMAWVAAFQVAMPVFLGAMGSAASLGAVVSVFALGMLAGSILSLRLRPRRPLIYGAGVTTLTVLPFVVLNVSPTLVLILPAAFVSGVATELFGVVWTTTMMTHVPRAHLSRMFAFDFLGGMCLTPVGFALAPALIARYSAETVMLQCSVVIVGACLMVLASPAVRGVTRVD